MRKIFLFLSLIFTSLIIFSQSEADKEKAYNLALEAIQLMDNGEIDKSLDLLNESCKLDPENYLYPYEIGYAYYLKKDFEESLKYYQKVIKMDGINSQCWQMLGNVYDMNGNPQKAIETYLKGLEAFPNAGNLYLELGNMHQNDWLKALEFYEKGIEIDPAYPSNYYWAAKIFCNSKQEMWGLFYGEIFMNIERGSARTEEISKLLYDTYKSEIQITSDSSVSVSLCEAIIIVDQHEDKMPYCLVYEPLIMLSLSLSDSVVNSKFLNSMRTNFVTFYYAKKFHKTHPNLVIEWHKQLIDKGYFEAYNHWILMMGSNEEFNIWYEDNKGKFDEFIQWFSSNPLNINEKNSFHRNKY